MRHRLISFIASGALAAAATTAGAQSLGDRFKQFVGGLDGGDTNASAQQLPESEVVSGLRSALADGASAAGFGGAGGIRAGGIVGGSSGSDGSVGSVGSEKTGGEWF